MNSFNSSNYSIDSQFNSYRHTFDFNGKNSQNFPDVDPLLKEKGITMKESMLLPGQ